MTKWFRAKACQWFHLTPNEVAVAANTLAADNAWNAAKAEIPEYDLTLWEDLWDHRQFRVVWPRLVMSEEWKRDLEPWFKHSLLVTFAALGQETDPVKLTRLQVRAQLINEWLERAAIGMQRDKAAFDNAFASGNRARLAEAFDERERAATNGRG